MLRCLEAEPERRFGHVGELAEALAPFGAEGTHSLVSEIVDTLRSPVRSLPPATAPLFSLLPPEPPPDLDRGTEPIPFSREQPAYAELDFSNQSTLLDLVRSRYRGHERLELDAEIRRAANPYQQAFGYLLATRGADSVNEVIREAVLKARLTPVPEAAMRGDHRACRALEEDLAGWMTRRPTPRARRRSSTPSVERCRRSRPAQRIGESVGLGAASGRERTSS